MANINNEAVDNILKYSNSEKIFLKALSKYKLRKTNIGENVIILLICTILAVTLGINPNIVSLVTNSVSIFLNVSLALFGIIFTGYAIFQTLLSNKLTIHLFEDVSIDST